MGLLPSGITSSFDKPLDLTTVFNLCVTINTDDYMTEDIPLLAKHVQKNIHPTYASQLDFAPCRDRFLDSASKVVTSLATRLSHRVEQWLDAMSKVNWQHFKEPGDQSMYAKQIHNVLKEFIPLISSTIKNAVYFRSFCDGFVNLFLRSYNQAVIRCRRIGGDGAQQLLIDVSALELTLLEIPTITLPNVEKKPTMPGAVTYKKFVENGLRRHKMYFKVLGMQAPLDILVENFSKLLAGSASITLLKHVLDVRGVSKASDVITAVKLAEEAGIPQTCADDVLIGNLTSLPPMNNTSSGGSSNAAASVAPSLATPSKFLGGLGGLTGSSLRNFASSASATPSQTTASTTASTPAAKFSSLFSAAKPIQSSGQPLAAPPPKEFPASMLKKEVEKKNSESEKVTNPFDADFKLSVLGGKKP